MLPTLFGIYLDDSKTAELTESLKSIKAKESYVSVSEKNVSYLFCFII